MPQHPTLVEGEDILIPCPLSALSSLPCLDMLLSSCSRAEADILLNNASHLATHSKAPSSTQTVKQGHENEEVN